MRKLTKKQLEIYNWLLDHPGYLKKGFEVTCNRLMDYNSNDILIARDEAKSKIKTQKDLGIIKVPKYKNHGTIIRKSYKIETESDKIYNEIKQMTRPKKANVYGMDPDNVLVIPDTHFPFEKEGILEHCLAMQKKYNCGTVVHIGDEVDLCSISQWEKDPDGFSAGTEATLAQEKMKIWYEVFPEVFVCIGNHSSRPYRLAKSNGLPKKFIKSYEEIWEAPKGWKWAEHWEFNGVLYTHGTGNTGDGAALRIATRHRQNTVIGHIHSSAGVQYSASKIDLVWGLQVGGALDDKSYAAFYAKDQLKKSIVGCGIVINGKLPIFEPMNL